MKKYLYHIIIFLCSTLLLSACNKSDNSVNGNNSFNNNSGQYGKGGSLARFTIWGNYMYVVDNTHLITYDISMANNPKPVKTTEIGFNIETIFPYDDKLFIGSRDAMFVYSIANPDNPVQIGQAGHLSACDPVVASDDVAYVTVRNGSACGGTLNVLYVYDITNPETPSEINVLQMTNPYGLGIKDNVLYVCDADAGLKVYKRGSGYQNYSLDFATSKGGYTFYDCIPYNNLLICMVEGGIVLYNIQSPENPVEITKIMN